MVPWFKTAEGRRRLEIETKFLGAKFPQFQIYLTEDDTAVAHGFIGGDRTIVKAYEILVRLPDNYGSGSLPDVFLLNEIIPPFTPHTLSGNRLCLLHSDEIFSPKSTLVVLLGWICCWLIAYETWKFDGKNIWADSL